MKKYLTVIEWIKAGGCQVVGRYGPDIFARSMPDALLCLEFSGYSLVGVEVCEIEFTEGELKFDKAILN